MRWVIVGLGIVCAAVVRWWFFRNVYSVPRGDPGAQTWCADGQLARLLTERKHWEAAILCDDGSGRPYRAGIRKVLGAEPSDAVAALCHLALGYPDRGQAIVDALPADDPDACEVRSRLYQLRGDMRRAHAAMTAAAEGSKNGEASRRAALADALARAR